MPGWFRIRPAVSGAWLLCSALIAAPGHASSLKDVRVGPHGEYTRVVLETDGKTSYSLNQGSDAITIELQATATPRAVAAKSQQLSWVRVEPQAGGSLVRIELKGPARVKQMVLTGPDRIVLDVYGTGEAAPSRPPSKPALAPREAARAVPAPAPSAEAQPAQPRLDEEDKLVHEEAEKLLGPSAETLPGDEVAATEGAPGEEQAAPEAATPEAAAPAVEQPPLPSPGPAAAPAPPSTKGRKGLLDWLGDPYILAGLAIVMAALFVILRRRRPAPKAKAKTVEGPPREEEASAASLFQAPEPPADTEPISVGEAEEAAPSVPPPAAEGPAESMPSDEGISPFDFEPPPTEPEKPEMGRAQGATLSTIASVTSTAAYETTSPIATGGLDLAELERRLALLEQRLEEVIDAKDRLERQVSAQTEELRVQRAAIARTQRVLRTVVRPEDESGSEPVLKS